jgi:hypothetical protein
MCTANCGAITVMDECICERLDLCSLVKPPYITQFTLIGLLISSDVLATDIDSIRSITEVSWGSNSGRESHPTGHKDP